MTINTYDPQRLGVGNGVTTAFSAPYIIDEEDLTVALLNATTGVAVLKTLGVDYTVAGVGNPAGSIVTWAVAPPAGYYSQINRDPFQEQKAHFIEGEDEPATAKEQSLDRIVMMIQALNLLGQTIDGRAVRVPYGESAITIPNIAARQAVGTTYRALSFDAVGAPIVRNMQVATYRFDVGVPANGLGIDEDIYFDTSNWNVYQRIAGVYVLKGTITGATGAPGAVWRYGVAAPANGLGVNGDFYLQTGGAGLGDVYEKVGGVQTFVVNIRGASGAGTGDVVGPAGVTADRIALFDGITGKLIKAHTTGAGALAGKNTIDAAALVDNGVLTYAKLAAASIATAAEINAGTASKLIDAAADRASLTPATPAYAASVAIDLGASCEHIIGALTGAIDLAAPTNAYIGQPVVVWLTQDATGGRAITVQATNWKLGSFTPSTAANKVDMITGVVKSLAPTVITGTYKAGVY